GAIQIQGEQYLELWKEYYVDRSPQAFLDQAYGAQLLRGQRPQWKCRAGSRFLYVDEFGKTQFCSAQRGRLNKPTLEYTRQDLRAWGRTYKGCEEGCALLCVYRDSVLDNRPGRTIGAALLLVLCQLACQACRLWAILPRDAALSIARTAYAFSLGEWANIFAPARAGDALKVVLLNRIRGAAPLSLPKATGAILADKV